MVKRYIYVSNRSIRRYGEQSYENRSVSRAERPIPFYHFVWSFSRVGCARDETTDFPEYRTYTRGLFDNNERMCFDDEACRTDAAR